MTPEERKLSKEIHARADFWCKIGLFVMILSICLMVILIFLGVTIFYMSKILPIFLGLVASTVVGGAIVLLALVYDLIFNPMWRS